MATLLQYSFTGSVWTPTTTASGLSGGSVTDSGSLPELAIDNDGFASDPELYIGNVDGATSAALAVTKNSYFYFTATPNSGKKLNLSALTFNVARYGASTPRGYVVRSSIDSYAADIASADVGTQRTTWTAANIDLSGSSYQNLTAAITFRIYAYGPYENNGLDMDDITLTGTVGDVSSGIGKLAWWLSAARWRSLWDPRPSGLLLPDTVI